MILCRCFDNCTILCSSFLSETCKSFLRIGRLYIHWQAGWKARTTWPGGLLHIVVWYVLSTERNESSSIDRCIGRFQGPRVTQIGVPAYSIGTVQYPPTYTYLKDQAGRYAKLLPTYWPPVNLSGASGPGCRSWYQHEHSLLHFTAHIILNHFDLDHPTWFRTVMLRSSFRSLRHPASRRLMSSATEPTFVTERNAVKHHAYETSYVSLFQFCLSWLRVLVIYGAKFRSMFAFQLFWSPELMHIIYTQLIKSTLLITVLMKMDMSKATTLRSIRTRTSE